MEIFLISLLCSSLILIHSKIFYLDSNTVKSQYDGSFEYPFKYFQKFISNLPNFGKEENILLYLITDLHEKHDKTISINNIIIIKPLNNNEYKKFCLENTENFEVNGSLELINMNFECSTTFYFNVKFGSNLIMNNILFVNNVFFEEFLIYSLYGNNIELKYIVFKNVSFINEENNLNKQIFLLKNSNFFLYNMVFENCKFKNYNIVDLEEINGQVVHLLINSTTFYSIELIKIKKSNIIINNLNFSNNYLKESLILNANSFNDKYNTLTIKNSLISGNKIISQNNEIISISNSQNIILSNNTYIMNKGNNLIHFKFLNSNSVIIDLLLVDTIISKSIFYFKNINNLNLDNIYLSNINNKNENIYASTIVIIEEFQLVNLKNITIKNSVSYSSTTCLKIFNYKTNDVIINLTHSFFIENVANYKESPSSLGSTIYYQIKSGLFNIYNITVHKNSIISSIPYSGAPCIYSLKQSNDQLIISNSVFSYNLGNFNELCIFYSGDNFTLIDSILSNNYNPTMDGSSSGAISLSSSNIKIKNVLINRNNASSGSAVYIQNLYNAPFIQGEFDCLFINKNRGFYSSVLFSSNLQGFNFTFTNSYFSHNIGLLKGGVVQTWYAVYGNIITFRNCIFIENSAVSSGGAFYVANLGNNMLLESCKFIFNAVTNDGGGGAICMYGDPNTVLTTKNSFFYGNKSPFKGGAVQITTGIFYDEGSSFIKNQANEAGVFAINFFSILNAINSNLEQSTALSNSGVLKMMGQSDVTFKNLTVKFSFAPRGGVFVTGGLTVLKIINCLFEMNNAINGTLMYGTNTAYSIFIKNTKFIKNGGARNLFELSSCNLILENLFFENNKVNLFYMELSSINLISSLIKNNHCEKGQLGCLFNIFSKSIVNISDSSFFNISSLEEHGNILSTLSKIIIINSNFSDLAIGIEAALLYASNSEIMINFSNISRFNSMAIKLSYSNISFINSIIYQLINNIGVQEGGFICLYCETILIENSIFKNIKNNMSDLGGAISIIYSKNNYSYYNFKILRSFFLFNQGDNGGAIKIEGCNILAENNLFEGNYANNGGGIFLFCEIHSDCLWNITSNNFTNNFANLSGGGIKWNPFLPINSALNLYNLNKALFGEDISSQPIKMRYLNLSNFTQFFAFQTGNTSDQFSMIILDHYDNIVKGIEGFGLIQIESENLNEMHSLVGSQIVQFLDNQLKFDKLTIVSTPNTTLYLTVTSPLIPYFYNNLIQNDFNTSSRFKEGKDVSSGQYEYKIKIDLRLCILGEIFIKEKNICKKCPIGQYSLDTKDTSCKECPNNAICYGGYNISLLPGFWRENETSTLIYQCIIENVCLGGYESLCISGYFGPLCDVCISTADVQFYKFGGTRCDSCENMNPLGYIIFVLFYFFLILYVSFTIKKNIESVNTTKTLDFEVPVFLKIGMDYLQVISIISMINVKWPTDFTTFLNTSGSAGNLNSVMFPFECVLAKITNTINIFYLKIFLGSIFAWVNFGFSGLVWLVYLKLRNKTIHLFKKEIIITLIVVGFTLQPSIVNMYFTAINCIEINGVSYVKSQLSIRCWESDHMSIFLIFIMPSIILWSIILPGICWFYVKKNIKSKDYQTRASLIYITKGVRLEYYYWEFIMMSKRYVLSIISAFLISDMTLTVSLILVTIFYYTILHLLLKPYNLNVFNSLQEYSFYSSYIVYLICLFYVVEQEGKSQFICLIFLIIGIFVFLGKFIKNIILAYKQKVISIVSRLNSFKSSIVKGKGFSPKQSIVKGSNKSSNKSIPSSSILKKKNDKNDNHPANKYSVKKAQIAPKQNKMQLKPKEINLKLVLK